MATGTVHMSNDADALTPIMERLRWERTLIGLVECVNQCINLLMQTTEPHIMVPGIYQVREVCIALHTLTNHHTTDIQCLAGAIFEMGNGLHDHAFNIADPVIERLVSRTAFALATCARLISLVDA